MRAKKAARYNSTRQLPLTQEKEAIDRHYFDEIASEWDRMRESAFNDAVREHAISVANVQAGSWHLPPISGWGPASLLKG